jgi:hypothetical protein
MSQLSDPEVPGSRPGRPTRYTQFRSLNELNIAAALIGNECATFAEVGTLGSCAPAKELIRRRIEARTAARNTVLTELLCRWVDLVRSDLSPSTVRGCGTA